MVLGEIVEKPQLVNFVAKVMEESGFKVYKNFKTSQKVVDIYAVLPTQMGDFGVVVACKNYDKEWEVGIDILKEMEMVGRSLKASKVAVVTSSTFSPQARNYASRKNIKLVDRDNLISLAKKYSKKNKEPDTTDDETQVVDDTSDQYYEDQYYNGYVDDYDANPSIAYSDYNGGDVYDDAYYEEVALANYQPDMYSSSYANSTKGNLHKTEEKKRNEPKKSRLSFLKRSPRNNNNNARSSRAPSTRPNRNVERRQSRSINLSSKLNQVESKKETTDLAPILGNPIVLILLVVIVSYLLTYILAILGGMSSGIIGLIEMAASLILSYGLVFLVDKDGASVLIKGSIVFFVSLIILIILIIFI